MDPPFSVCYGPGRPGRPADILDPAEWIGVPVVTLRELRTGFLLGGQSERNEA
jgi:hypothetical protein